MRLIQHTGEILYAFLVKINLSPFFLLCLLLFSGCASKKGAVLPRAMKNAMEFNRRGIEAVNEGRYDMALSEFQKSMLMNTGIDNQEGIAWSQINIGRLYLLMDKPEYAKAALDRAVNIGISLNNQAILSEAYGTAGRYYYLGGRYREAVGILEKAADIDHKAGSPVAMLNLMGLAYRDIDMLEKAEQVFQEAIKSGDEKRQSADAADSYRGLADVVLKRGESKKALELYEKALDIDKQAGISYKISLDLHGIGVARLKQGDISGALDYFLRANDVSLASGNKKMQLINIEWIVEIYNKLGNKDAADMYLKKKDTLFQKER